MRNEGYIFIRGSTWITLDKVVGQTRGSWVDGWSRRFVYYGMGGMGERDCLLMGMGGLEEWVD